jgi:HEAT repeat protein
VLTSDECAGVRSLAAKDLGRSGSADCIEELLYSARRGTWETCEKRCSHPDDPRWHAVLALAGVARRFPRSRGRVADGIRALPYRIGPPDSSRAGSLANWLGEARLQALFQVTRDRKLIEPFYKRLESPDAEERKRGVVAFLSLGLEKAPPELVDMLDDPEAGVRGWAACVLGKIGDPGSAVALAKVAGDANMDRGTRCNALSSLGRMKVKEAVSLFESLLHGEADPIPAQAAIALYRTTGRKVEQFPKGFNAD